MFRIGEVDTHEPHQSRLSRLSVFFSGSGSACCPIAVKRENSSEDSKGPQADLTLGMDKVFRWSKAPPAWLPGARSLYNWRTLSTAIFFKTAGSVSPAVNRSM